MDSLTLFLEPNYERFAPDIPYKIKEAYSSNDKKSFMQHQIDTYNANQEFDIVVNTYPTGTGKTTASLLHLIDIPYSNALFIAPTNELISQHCKDIKKFVKDVNLSHKVIEINAKVIENIRAEKSNLRKGEILYRLLANPLDDEFIDKLDISREDIDYSCPYILVTNPDIFYYAIMFVYNNHDKRNIFHEVFIKFSYIVIDEFHYYNPKQLTCFLFFFTLSLKFGYFKDGKKRLTILTATPLPQVINYFERLENEGIKCKILESERIEPKDLYSEKTLSPVKVTFYPTANNFSENIQNNLDFIENNLKDKKDGAIISNSLININDCRNILRNKNITDFGMITGVTDKEDRNLSQGKSIILATPTVDIGYNFDRVKNRQNIDYIIFDFKYEDQFWQRLGRAGRVLGKEETDMPSDVIVFTDSDTISKLKESFQNGQLITRQQLKIQTIKHFRTREDLYHYIDSYGISEISRPVEELKKIFSKGKEHIVTKDLFDSICKVFTGKSGSYYHKIQKFSKRYNSLKEGVKDITKCSPEIIEEFKKLYLKDDIKNLKKALENFLQEEYFMVDGLYSFRESFQGVPTLVYDPKTLMGFDSNKVFSYDLFHLLKYYNLKFFSSKAEFFKHNNIKNLNYKENFFCEIIERIEDNQSISFSHNSEFDKEFFEDRYLNKLIAKNNIEFQIYINKKSGKINKTMDLRLDVAVNLFKEKYIPCLIINYKLQSECRKNNIIPVDFNVTFKDGFSEKYFIVLGTNAYLIASNPKFKFIVDYMTKKTEFYIC